MGERFKVAVNSLEAGGKKVSGQRFMVNYLFTFVQRQFKVQFGNLMIDDEDLFIRKRRFGVLQT